VADADSDGFAGRIYLGYQDNKNFAFEFGYTHFSKADIDDIEVTEADESPGTRSGDIEQAMIDLTMKIIFPSVQNTCRGHLNFHPHRV